MTDEHISQYVWLQILNQLSSECEANALQIDLRLLGIKLQELTTVLEAENGW